MRSHANVPLLGLLLCGWSGVGILGIWLSVRTCLSARGNLLSGTFGCLGTYPAVAFMSLWGEQSADMCGHMRRPRLSPGSYGCVGIALRPGSFEHADIADIADIGLKLDAVFA